MKTYCVRCKKNTSNKNSSVRRTKQNSLILVSNRAIYCKKNQGSLTSRSKQVIEQIRDRSSINSYSIN